MAIHVTKIKPEFTDERGYISRIVDQEKIKIRSVLEITGRPGSVRGNHYHKKSTQYSYVLGGKIELTIKKINEKKIRKIILKEGDLTTIPRNMIHTYRALENSSMLDLTTYARGIKGYETDTVRV